ncbi:hypothetical protein FACS1894170_11750 [Planctomycetales bacterium]|nr:hypothetical protein FACS1894170_11750 [Planctomycetales bacterium]
MTSENKLTTEKIDAVVKDVDLIEFVWQRLWEDFSGAASWRAKFLQESCSWNEAKTFFVLIHLLWGEVGNGGFEQFYFNGGDEYADDIPTAFRYFGADKMATVVEEANEIYLKEHAKITATHDGTLEGFFASYKDNPLQQFDKKFYALDEGGTLEKLLAQYIRQHKQDFIDE